MTAVANTSVVRTSDPSLYNQMKMVKPESQISVGSTVYQFIANEAANIGCVIELTSDLDFMVMTIFNDIDQAFDSYRLKA